MSTAEERKAVRSLFAEGDMSYKDHQFYNFYDEIASWFDMSGANWGRDEFIEACKRFANEYFGEQARRQTIPRGYLR